MRSFTLVLLLAAAAAGQSQEVQAALGAGSYFPLEPDSRWVYRIDNRFVTGAYQTWRVDNPLTIGGRIYSGIIVSDSSGEYEIFFRADTSGKIYVLTGSGEQLFLDAAGGPGATGQLEVTSRGQPVHTAVGDFQDALAYTNHLNSLTLETGMLARGIGLVSSATTLETGSSGGFLEGRTLMEATIGGKLVFTAGMPGVQLGIASQSLDVSNQKADNCAVPCYFVACGLTPGADPPGTYKPCVRARVAVSNWPANASHTFRIRLLAGNNTALFTQDLGFDGAPGDSVRFISIPLYSAGNQPLEPGSYQLTAAAPDGSGLASIAVEIR
jgi:hypothetical protein